MAYTTPQKSWSAPFCGSSYTPERDDSLKPAVGMTFEDIDSAKEFYKTYAAHVGFPVRVGQHKAKNGLVTNKRFYCSREGFRKAKDETQSEPEFNGKRKCERKITRCGCLAMIALKRTKKSKYIITTFVEEHTHALVSPDKQHLIRSNREVGEKVKITLFNFHRASIGTSDAYRFLRVGLGSFENVGCTLKDLQNYHGKLRCLIKSSDAQMFVDQLSRKTLANPAFYFDYVIDEKGRLVHVFWADATYRKNYAHFGDLVSFDSTYSTNEYNMIFTPFTGIKHHKANVLFGAALLSNEKIDSYTWLFKTFLNAMGGIEL
ncbi:protein FAR1-RELATED SEQUENCE 5-like isoform X2 [Panicum virgatum]|nr:protein FAR1-RELATED SEQUENCE 5-like isoform X2 [Panicum virgatum]